MILSKACEYGLRAMLYLAAHDPDGYEPIGTISDELGISFQFLTKTLQQLNDAGLVTTKRGPGGGVSLTRSPDAITLYDVVAAIDGTDLFEECILGLPGCGDAEPCPLHEQWTEGRSRIESRFQETTLADVPQQRLTAVVADASEVKDER
jgi:Rrf2 family protein